MDLKYSSFEKGGAQHTNATLEIAKANADLLGIKKIVVASTTGTAISAAQKVFAPSTYNLIGVTHSYGWNDTIEVEFPETLRTKLQQENVTLVTGTLPFSGVDTALLTKYQYWDFPALFARNIRAIIGDGVKVAIEIVLMATDAGKIKRGEDVIAIAGTGSGSDTCCLIQAASTRTFDHLKVKTIFCKPQIARE